MKLLDGKRLSKELIKEYDKAKNITLAIIKSENTDNSNYIKNIVKTCEKINIKTIIYEEEIYKIKSLIKKLNDDNNITGILIMHDTMHFDDFIKEVNENKDVEGLTKNNIYNLYIGKEKIIPCTVKGIIKLLKHYEINLEGKNVVIIGRSIIAGKPLALALTNRNATVTLCHSKTDNLKEITKKADIIISLAGIPKYIKKDMVKEGFIGIDGAVNNIDNEIVGDFDYEDVKDKASYMTKAVGGVGPMTTTMLIDNLIKLKQIQGE